MKRWIKGLCLLSILIVLSTACNLPKPGKPAELIPTIDTPVITQPPTREITPTPTVQNTPIPPSLRNYAETKGLQLGTYLMWNAFDDPAWKEIAGREFDMANLFDGFNWAELEPEQGKFNFSVIDPQVDFALSNNMRVCAHTLLWPSYDAVYPQWVLNGHYSKSEMSALLQNYVTTVVKHYQGKITCWIAVEEPYNPPERDWDLLYATFGDYSYIDLVYKTIREADPDALLIYNDCDNLTADDENTSLTHQIIERLSQEGIVDAVGMCMHLDASDPPDQQEVSETMKSYGVPVHITEILVNLADLPGTQQERYEQQAEIYASMLEACLESVVCKSYSVWGFGDKYSYTEYYDSESDSTLCDDNLQPKPAYDALVRVLRPDAN